MKTDPSQHLETPRRVIAFAGLALVLVASCGGVAPLYCDEETPCSDPARPFCDLTGEFPESEGHGRTCIADPSDGGSESCEPSSITCDESRQVVCGADGRVERVDECALGCSSSERCIYLDPSNGHREALLEAPSAPTLDLKAGATINTDTGSIVDSDGTVVVVPFERTTVEGTPTLPAVPIGVFTVRSATFEDVRITGNAAFVLLAFESITLDGVLDASASDAGGPGALTDLQCNRRAQSADGRLSGTFFFAVGNVGAYHVALGDYPYAGSGGVISLTDGSLAPRPKASDAVGRAGNAELVPLRGGCAGGALSQSNAEGGGGGAVQLVSNTAIIVGTRAGIAVGGAGGFKDDFDGGAAGAGGGSGGGLLLEAPIVSIRAEGGLTANGGGGGSFVARGEDANSISLVPAMGGVGATAKGAGGLGATVDLVNGTPGEGRLRGDGDPTMATTAPGGGGGGGGLGRIRINTPQDDFSPEAGAILSPTPTTGLIPFF